MFFPSSAIEHFFNYIFQVITPFRNLVLCAESRKDMEEWITALKTSSKKEYFEVSSIIIVTL